MSDMVRITQQFTVPKDWRPVPTDAWDVKVEGRLARAAWWLLKKFGKVSPHFDREMMVESIMLDARKASVRIVEEAQVQFMRMYPGVTAKRVFIGSEDFANLMSDPAILRMGAFDFLGSLPYADHNGDRRLLGLQVDVVPHMKGILVV